MIPALNEESCVARVLKHLSTLDPPPAEIIVSVGDPADATAAPAQKWIDEHNAGGAAVTYTFEGATGSGAGDAAAAKNTAEAQEGIDAWKASNKGPAFFGPRGLVGSFVKGVAAWGGKK